MTNKDVCESNQDNHTHVVIVMRYDKGSESYSYTAADYFFCLLDAVNYCVKNGCQAQYEDILIACDMSEISDLPNKAYHIYVVNEYGAVKQVPAPTISAERRTWIWSWEYSKRNDVKIKKAIRMGIKHQAVLALCECLEGFEKYTKNEAAKKEAMSVIDYCAKYAYSLEAGIYQGSPINPDTFEHLHSRPSLLMPIERAFHQMSICVWFMSMGKAAQSSEHAFEAINAIDIFCEERLGMNFNEKMIEMGYIIRKHIPLHMILLAAAESSVVV